MTACATTFPLSSFKSNAWVSPNVIWLGSVILVVSPADTVLLGKSNVPLIRNLSHCDTLWSKGLPSSSVILNEVIKLSCASRFALVGARGCFSVDWVVSLIVDSSVDACVGSSVEIVVAISLCWTSSPFLLSSFVTSVSLFSFWIAVVWDVLSSWAPVSA